MKTINAVHGRPIALGRAGENGVRTVVFDVAAWAGTYDDEGTARLLYLRPGEEAPYPVEIVRDDIRVLWTVSDVDTAIAGEGKAELQYVIGDRLEKSCIYETYVAESLSAPTDTPPASAAGWVEKVYEAGDTAEKSAETATDAAARAEDAARRAEMASGTMEIGDGLKWVDNKLTVDTADKVEQDNTKPVTSAAVYTELGNIEAILASI